LVKKNDKAFDIMSFIQEFWDYIKTRKKYWLLPILMALLAFSFFIIISEGTAVAPFIYAIF